MRIVLACDGSCPKPNGPGGYAALLVAYAEDGSVLKERIAVGGHEACTNNTQELRAVIAGLEMLARPTELTVVVDSQYVMHGFTEGWVEKWKRNGWRKSGGGRAQAGLFDGEPKAVKNRELWERLDELVAQHRIHWHHVRGHVSRKHPDFTPMHELNLRVDELAGAETRKIKECAQTQGVC